MNDKEIGCLKTNYMSYDSQMNKSNNNYINFQSFENSLNSG